jgi:hypothetical protein
MPNTYELNEYLENIDLIPILKESLKKEIGTKGPNGGFIKRLRNNYQDQYNRSDNLVNEFKNSGTNNLDERIYTLAKNIRKINDSIRNSILYNWEQLFLDFSLENEFTYLNEVKEYILSINDPDNNCLRRLKILITEIIVTSLTNSDKSRGGQAALTGKTLMDMGYMNVSNVGAIGDWKKNDGPMTK